MGKAGCAAQTDAMRNNIDWQWVTRELSRTERIPTLEKDGLKNIVHIYVERCLVEAKAEVRPRTLSVPRKILRIGADSIKIEGDVLKTGKRLISYLKGADSVVILLVTLGRALEERATTWMSEGEPLYGYLLDRIGSIAAEALAQNLEDRLRGEYANKDKSVSMRFSPGYCDWPIEEQFKLDSLIGFSKAGVRLNKSCMMIPKKSITAIVGVGPKGLFSKSRSPCRFCGIKECLYSR
jgi:hypothetical protein